MTADRQNTDEMPVYGLSDKEVQERIREGKVNVQPDTSAKSVKDIVFENTFTYFNAIFLLLAILLIAAHSYKNLTFLPVVIANTLIGIGQELYAKKVLDNLAVLHQATARVLRGGREEKIPIAGLVEGDVIHLKAGDQIAADAEVLLGTAAVNEALLTGEQDEIEKTAGEGKGELRSGSFVVSGECFATLTRVGSESYISKLTMKAKEMRGTGRSEMVRDIDRLILIFGILIIPIGITLFIQSMMNGYAFSEAVTSMVAAVVGMIPEGLYLLVSVALALSAVRLAQKDVILHDMRSIETLARVDVLCVDKTGTITDGEMAVSDFVAPDSMPPESLTDTARLIGCYLGSIADDNSTMQALRRRFKSGGTLEARQVLPFSSKNKYSEIETGDGVYRLGAPEMVLDAATRDSNADIIGHYENLGERVLVFARNTAQDKDGERLFCPMAFIALRNSLRKNVEKTFDFFRQQGVDVRVISGDSPVTVSRIAKSAGIRGADKYIDMSSVNSREEIEKAVAFYTVFGRTRPEQKKELVRALKRQKHKVAMTGDGVNDILAMKEADCSIAIGNGSDAAMQAAQVVLLDSDFNRMTSIVAEGRTDINNISRSATLFLVKNIFSLLLALFSIVNVVKYPLQPTQISLISMFNIGIPAFFLALEANNRRQKPHFLRRVLISALPAALTDFFTIAGLVWFGSVFGVSEQDVSVASTFLLAIVGFMILGGISAPLNKFRSAVITGCVLGLIFTSWRFNGLFGIQTVSMKCAMLFSVFAIAEEPVMRYLTKLNTWLDDKLLSEG
ncbi:MAG: cation-translocating P-type ATPase [Lachnospiraceae bacterium]|jgi:cation-transporting ATPase E|nr:cation-translocating P-type ATPase [Lachnospiraceae bacterium]